MLRKALYPVFESLIHRVAARLHAKKITANQLTIAGAILSFLVGYIYASGHLFLGGIALLVTSLTDLLDGPLARTTGTVSKFGAFLDSTLDRYADCFIFGGIAVYYARGSEYGYLMCTLGVLAGAFVTSYAKARAENFISDCGVGILGRAERILLVALGSILWPLLPFTLVVLLIGTNATAIYRILHTRKILAAEKN
jgi:CDP-diacylglycerol--glycerol-3-phosphate 3-phosphatidyltransferase